MIIHGDNLVKSVNRYQLHITVCRTTRPYHGTMATKVLSITCPSANIIGIKGYSRVDTDGLMEVAYSCNFFAVSDSSTCPDLGTS